jgi:peptidylprolyl isomerase
MVGAGRDVAADSSDGTSLYAVTGQSPRMLDRNITLVGRVVQGIELLMRAAARHRSARLLRRPEAVRADHVGEARQPGAAAERTKLELLRTDSKTFATVVESRRNRRTSGTSAPPATSICATCPCRCDAEVDRCRRRVVTRL